MRGEMKNDEWVHRLPLVMCIAGPNKCTLRTSRHYHCLFGDFLWNYDMMEFPLSRLLFILCSKQLSKHHEQLMIMAMNSRWGKCNETETWSENWRTKIVNENKYAHFVESHNKLQNIRNRIIENSLARVWLFSFCKNWDVFLDVKFHQVTKNTNWTKSSICVIRQWMFPPPECVIINYASNWLCKY